jgi:hypothetical protein
MDDKTILERLRALNADIPDTLSWDWENTNHYELHDEADNGEYFWLNVLELGGCRPLNMDIYLPDTEDGQRLGKIIEYAVLARKLFPKLISQLEGATL